MLLICFIWTENVFEVKMKNTVLEGREVPACVEEIRLLLNNSLGCGKICVVVEGVDDVKAYGSLFDDLKVMFHPAGTCAIIPNTMDLVCQDVQLKDSVIGIKDADFDHLMGKEYHNDNLFLTDTHDVETLMLTERVEQRVCREMAGNSCPGIREKAMRILKPYSYIQYYNAKEILKNKGTGGLLFKGFKPHIVEENAYHDWYQAVKSHGNNASNENYPSEEQLSHFIEANETEDLLNLTRGHDIVHLIGVLLHNVYPACKNKSCGEIAGYIRVAYTFEEFQQTALFKAIDSWSQARNISLWVA